MRRKKVPSRRARAVRRVLLLAALLALWGTAGGYGFLPSKGIRANEETVNLGPTEVLRDLGALPLKGAGWSRAYLSANENGMLLSLCRFEPLYGWLDYGFSALDCSGEGALHGAAYSVSKTREGKENRGWYLYGRVDDLRGERLTASVGYEGGGGKWTELEALELPREEWTERSGRAYFLTELPLHAQEEHDYPLNVRLTLTDGAGAALAGPVEAERSGTGLG